MKTLIALTSVLILSGLVISCTRNQDTSTAMDTQNSAIESQNISVIQSPFSSFSVQPSAISVSEVEKGGTVILSENTTLEFPAGSFVYADGTPVSGDVTLTYREFLDAFDIVAAGIPMQYDSAGTSYHFQTAGMFDLYGTKDNKEIFVAEGKSLNVNMKSNVPETNYNFYQMDTTTGIWNYLGPIPVENEKVSDAGALADNFPVAPQPYDPEGHLIDLKIDVSDYPELVDLKGIMWQYAGNDPQGDLLSKKWIYAEKWHNIELIPQDKSQSLFRLSLKNERKAFAVLVKPVLAGKAFDRAMELFRIRKEEYSRRLDKERRARVERDEMVTRVMGIRQFGLYNVDRIYRNTNAVFVDANIVIDHKEFKESSAIYLITGASRVAIRFKKDDLKKFRFVTEDDNALVVILPDNRVALFSNDDFQKLDANQLNRDGRFDFHLVTMPEEVISADRFRALIGG